MSGSDGSDFSEGSAGNRKQCRGKHLGNGITAYPWVRASAMVLPGVLGGNYFKCFANAELAASYICCIDWYMLYYVIMNKKVRFLS